MMKADRHNLAPIPHPFMRMLSLSLLAVVMAAILLASSFVYAAPSAELWQRWTKHNADNATTLDHSVWGQILKRYVVQHESGVNRFAYQAVSASDYQNLLDYLNFLAAFRISDYNRDVQRAFWINLYNALTIEVILRHYPVESIRDISSGFFTSGPWDQELITVEAETLTLNDIEHRILRPIWKDPRLHYAINCASIGCPNLQPQAFTADNTESMLNSAAFEFINHPRAATINTDGKLQASSIYRWFSSDFGDEAGVLEHLLQYAQPPLRNKLKNIHEIDEYEYNWTLNSPSH